MDIIGSCDPQNRLKSPYRISPRNPSPPKVYRKKVICTMIITIIIIIYSIIVGMVLVAKKVLMTIMSKRCE